MSLTNAQYDMLMREYQKRQDQSYQQTLARREEIYSRFPEFAAIDNEIASAGVSCARRMLSEESASIASLRNRISILSHRKKELLLSAGYPADYLEPHYHCPDCKDTGYIDSVKCHCFRQAAVDLLYMQSNLRDVLADETFDSFSFDYYSDQIVDPKTGRSAAEIARKTFEECRSFAQNFDTTCSNILLFGNTGLGKTFLSHCIARELLDHSHSVLYFTSFNLFELLSDSAFGRTDQKRSEVEEHIFSCDLLIIDDLGTEMVNTFIHSRLFHVINERLLRQKSTFISTNLELNDFANTYTERIFSRISGNYKILKLIGKDIRLQKKLYRK